ncbi:MAG: hypothetical protein R2695_09870 [Acidimicrobiales bacterium]
MRSVAWSPLTGNTTQIEIDGVDEPIVLWKTPWMVERYVALADEFRCGTIVEIGIHEGEARGC